jgi:large subunit ribosomal protein L10
LAITKERKQELVAVYKQILQHSNGFIVTEFQGLPMSAMNDLRAKLRGMNSVYVITKNTLFGIALRESGWAVPENMLLGPSATAFADGDVAALAKAMLAFEKENPDKVKIKGGVMGQNILAAQDVQAISELPPLGELRAQLLGLIVQPPTGLVNVLNAATSDIVNLLHAYVQENDGEAA